MLSQSPFIKVLPLLIRAARDCLTNKHPVVGASTERAAVAVPSLIIEDSGQDLPQGPQAGQRCMLFIIQGPQRGAESTGVRSLPHRDAPLSFRCSLP
jgi:hypothetical protein